jgi:hypothetical protein
MVYSGRSDRNVEVRAGPGSPARDGNRGDREQRGEETMIFNGKSP